MAFRAHLKESLWKLTKKSRDARSSQAGPPLTVEKGCPMWLSQRKARVPRRVCGGHRKQSSLRNSRWVQGVRLPHATGRVNHLKPLCVSFRNTLHTEKASFILKAYIFNLRNKLETIPNFPIPPSPQKKSRERKDSYPPWKRPLFCSCWIRMFSNLSGLGMKPISQPSFTSLPIHQSLLYFWNAEIKLLSIVIHLSSHSVINFRASEEWNTIYTA